MIHEPTYCPSKFRELLKSPGQGIAFVSLILITFVFLRVSIQAWDISKFSTMPQDRVEDSSLLHHMTFTKEGYDGFYSYLFARNPIPVVHRDSLSNRTLILGVMTTKNLPFRLQRIGYPTLAWLLAGFGHSTLVPYSLVMVNLLMTVLLFLSLFRWCQLFEHDKMTAYTILLLPGVYFCIGRNLVDLTAVSLAITALYTLQRKVMWLFVILGALAILSKESVLPFILIPLLILPGISTSDRFKWILLTILPFLAWWAFINYNYPSSSRETALLNNLTFPGSGISAIWSTGLWTSSLKLIILLGTVGLTVDVIRGFKYHSLKTLKTDWVFLTLLIYGILSICFSHKIYEDHWSLARNLLPLHVICLMALIRNKTSMSLPTLILLFLSGTSAFLLSIWVL